MSLIIGLSIFLIVWTIASFVWFWNVLGQKYRKSKWYDAPLSVPFFVIAHVIGFVRYIFDKSYRNGK